jgi:hypothetical protein
MQNTNHDLSANVAKLNLNNLIELAQMAAGAAKVACERELSGLQHTLLYNKEGNKESVARYDAQNLAKAAHLASIAFENLFYLTEAKERDEIVVIKNELMGK